MTAPTAPPVLNAQPATSLRRRDFAIASVLALCFFAVVYLPMALQIVHSSAALENNLLFGGDMLRVIQDLAVFQTPHWRTPPHPLFLILFNPIGVAIVQFSSPPVAAAMLLAAAGGVAVALAHLTIVAMGLPRISAALLAVTLGSSGTHIVFATAPETYIFSAAALLFLAFCLQARPGQLLWSVLAGVLATGVLVSNLVPASLIFWSSLRKIKHPAGIPTLKRWAIWAACVATLVMSFNVVQRLIYPGAGLLTNRGSMRNEVANFLFIPHELVGWTERANNLVQTMALVNFVAPAPQVEPGQPRNVQFDTHAIKNVSPFGKLGLALVLALWASTIVAFLQQRLWRDPLVQAILGCLAFNFLLHMVYGAAVEFYLYSCNWTALVVLLWARCWRDWTHTPPRAWVFNICIAVLAAICLGNSLDFMAACLRLW